MEERQWRCQTWNTLVTGFQVPRQIRQTRSPLIHFRIRYSQLALLPPGTVSIQHVDDVTIATDEAEVDTHAATNAHAPVATGSYQDHVIVLAPGRKFLGRTKVCRSIRTNISICSANQSNNGWITVRKDRFI